MFGKTRTIFDDNKILKGWGKLLPKMSFLEPVFNMILEQTNATILEVSNFENEWANFT